MSETEDARAALTRLETALSRIAAQVAKPRSAPAADDRGAAPGAMPEGASAESAAATEAARHAIVTRLDDLIGGLRSALGMERPT
ncbi:hypothetical protein [Acidisoma sp. C75]